jgi:PAS domain-containing protein
VSALGHQKAILAKVASLSADAEAAAATARSATAATPVAATGAGVKNSVSEAELSSVDDNSESNSSSATNAANRLELIVLYGDARRLVVVKRSYGLDRVLSKLEDVFGFPVEIKIKGVLVEEAGLWQDAISRHATADPLELVASREDPNKIHKEERSMLHGLVDACFVIDKEGTVLFQNMAAEDLLGYETKEIVGKNVKELTPPDIRVKHDTFLRVRRDVLCCACF